MAEDVSTWRVTQQAQEFGIGPDNRATDGYRVYFTTAAGNNGNVFIPRATYNLEAVRVAVGQAAAQMDSVSRLVG